MQTPVKALSPKQGNTAMADGAMRAKLPTPLRESIKNAMGKPKKRKAAAMEEPVTEQVTQRSKIATPLKNDIAQAAAARQRRVAKSMIQGMAKKATPKKATPKKETPKNDSFSLLRIHSTAILTGYGSRVGSGHLSESIQSILVGFVVSMRKVESGNIHSGIHELGKALFRPTGRADRADDLGPAVQGVERLLDDAEFDTVIHG